MVAIQLTFHCDTTCLSCIDEVKLINDCASFFFLFFLLLSLFTTKAFIIQVFYSKSKLFLVVLFQYCSVYIAKFRVCHC